ncbi:MAG: class I SAM-dependent methyltransferase [Candidatus Omnitrophota bacterium]
MDLKNSCKRIIPKSIRHAIKGALGIRDLNDRITLLNQRIFDIETKMDEVLYRQDNWERSRKRWRTVEPDKGLTWNREISGDNFIIKIKDYVNFNTEKQILEIGPGYGRLLRSLMKMKIPFKGYTGLDISPKNISHLRSAFPEETLDFVEGDVEHIDFVDKTFDIVYSSLTFKHFFPTFENALRNITRHVNPGAMIAFDLIEGEMRTFENDGTTYLHSYTKQEVSEILERVSLMLVSFNQVDHTTGFSRLLVVAKK